MDDVPHVRLVDAHAEGDGRDEAHRVLFQERILVARTHLRRQAGVIGQRRHALVGQPLGGLFDLVAAEAINDAALALVTLQEAQQLLGAVRALHDRV